MSMNRGERLKAIEQRIAKLKFDADTKAAAALSAASEAQDVRDSLDALRVQGENRRTELTGSAAIRCGETGRANGASSIKNR
ncbi:hypothetical protein [Bifidobacterium catenulatum]|uniref:hypothetical protein n=1 Tax=Bifidobacterium catenulatum TaxID=1686 RepID=UPI003267D3FF